MFRRARLSVKPNVKSGIGTRGPTASVPQRAKEAAKPPEPVAASAPKPSEPADGPLVDLGGTEPQEKAPRSSDEKTDGKSQVEESCTVSQRRKRVSSSSALEKPPVSVPSEPHPLIAVRHEAPKPTSIPAKEKQPCSDRYRIYKAQKLREMLKEELRKEKKQWKNKYAVAESERPPDRSKMTMRDFIYYLPNNNPMTSSLEQEKKTEKASTPVQTRDQESKSAPDAEESDGLEEETDDGPLLVPRVKVAEDGSIILDEESLTVEVLRTKGPCVVEENDPIFERGSTTTYSSFRKNYYSKPWSNKETDMFFLAISMVGTDFSMIGQLFPHRARIEIKNKFKREEKTNGWRIDKAFQEKRPFDFDFFAHLLQKVLAEEEKRKQKSVKNQNSKEKSSKSRKKVKVKKGVSQGMNESSDESLSTKIADTEGHEEDVQTIEEQEPPLTSSEQDSGQSLLESNLNQKHKKRRGQDKADEQQAKSLLGNATVQSGPSTGEKCKNECESLMPEVNEGECNREQTLACSQNTDDVVDLPSSEKDEKRPGPILSSSSQQDGVPEPSPSDSSPSQVAAAALSEVNSAESSCTEERNVDGQDKSLETNRTENAKPRGRGRFQKPKPSLSRAVVKTPAISHSKPAPESKSSHAETSVEKIHMGKDKMSTDENLGTENSKKENSEAETISDSSENICVKEDNQPKTSRPARLTRGRLQKPKPNVGKIAEKKEILISQEKVGSDGEKNEKESCINKGTSEQVDDQSCKIFDGGDVPSQSERKVISYQDVQPDESKTRNECLSFQEENEVKILKQTPVVRTRFKKPKPNIGRGTGKREIFSKEEVSEKIQASGEMESVLREIPRLETSPMESVPAETDNSKEIATDSKETGRRDDFLSEKTPEMIDLSLEMETSLRETGQEISPRENIPKVIAIPEERELEDTKRELSPQEKVPEVVPTVGEAEKASERAEREISPTQKVPEIISASEERARDREEIGKREISPQQKSSEEEVKTMGEVEKALKETERDISSTKIPERIAAPEDREADVEAIRTREASSQKEILEEVTIIHEIEKGFQKTEGEIPSRKQMPEMTVASEESEPDLGETGRREIGEKEASSQEILEELKTLDETEKRFPTTDISPRRKSPETMPAREETGRRETGAREASSAEGNREEGRAVGRSAQRGSPRRRRRRRRPAAKDAGAEDSGRSEPPPRERAPGAPEKKAEADLRGTRRPVSPREKPPFATASPEHEHWRAGSDGVAREARMSPRQPPHGTSGPEGADAHLLAAAPAEACPCSMSAGTGQEGAPPRIERAAAEGRAPVGERDVFLGDSVSGLRTIIEEMEAALRGARRELSCHAESSATQGSAADVTPAKAVQAAPTESVPQEEAAGLGRSPAEHRRPQEEATDLGESPGEHRGPQEEAAGLGRSPGELRGPQEEDADLGRSPGEHQGPQGEDASLGEGPGEHQGPQEEAASLGWSPGEHQGPQEEAAGLGRSPGEHQVPQEEDAGLGRSPGEHQGPQEEDAGLGRSPGEHRGPQEEDAGLGRSPGEHRGPQEEDAGLGRSPGENRGPQEEDAGLGRSPGEHQGPQKEAAGFGESPEEHQGPQEEAASLVRSPGEHRGPHKEAAGLGESPEEHRGPQEEAAGLGRSPGEHQGPQEEAASLVRSPREHRGPQKEAAGLGESPEEHQGPQVEATGLGRSPGEHQGPQEEAAGLGESPGEHQGPQEEAAGLGESPGEHRGPQEEAAGLGRSPGEHRGPQEEAARPSPREHRGPQGETTRRSPREHRGHEEKTASFPRSPSEHLGHQEEAACLARSPGEHRGPQEEAASLGRSPGEHLGSQEEATSLGRSPGEQRGPQEEATRRSPREHRGPKEETASFPRSPEEHLGLQGEAAGLGPSPGDHCRPPPSPETQNTSSSILPVVPASAEEERLSGKEVSSCWRNLKASSPPPELSKTEDQAIPLPNLPEQFPDTNASKSLPQEQKSFEVKTAPFVRSRFKRPKPNLARATLKRETTEAEKHIPREKLETDKMENVVIQQKSEQADNYTSSQDNVASLMMSKEKDESDHKEKNDMLLPCVLTEKKVSHSCSSEPEEETRSIQAQENDLVSSTGTYNINTCQKEMKESGVQTTQPLRRRLHRPIPNVRKIEQRQRVEKVEAKDIVTEERTILQKEETKKCPNLPNSPIGTDIEVVSSKVSEYRSHEDQSHVVLAENLHVNKINDVDEKTREEHKTYSPSPAPLVRRHFHRPKPNLRSAHGKRKEPETEKDAVDHKEARKAEDNLLQQGDSDIQHLPKKKAEPLTSLASSAGKDCEGLKEAVSAKKDAQFEEFGQSGSVGKQTLGNNSLSLVIEEQHLSKLSSCPQLLKESHYSKIALDRRSAIPSASECDLDHGEKRIQRKSKPNVHKGRGSKRNRGKSSKKEPRPSKAVLVTLRASQEEEEDDAEDFASDYEEESYLAPEELSKAPVFVPLGLRSPEPVPTQIEETMEELEISVNVPDATCIAAVEPQLFTTDGPAQETEPEADVNAFAIEMTIGEQTQDEAGPNDGSTEAAITLLTMGDLVLQSENSTEQDDGLGIVPDGHSKDNSYIHLSPVHAKHNITHECLELSSPVISLSPALYEEKTVIVEEQNTSKEVGLLEKIKENATPIRKTISKVTNNLRIRNRFPKPKPNLNRMVRTERLSAHQGFPSGTRGEEGQIQKETEEYGVKGTDLEDKNLGSVIAPDNKEQNTLACAHAVEGTSISQEANLTEKIAGQEEEAKEVQRLSVAPVVSSETRAHMIGLGGGPGESCVKEPLTKLSSGDSVPMLHGPEYTSIPEVQQENVLNAQDLTVNLVANVHQDAEDEQTFILTLVEIPTDAVEMLTNTEAQLMPTPLLPAPILVKSVNTENRSDLRKRAHCELEENDYVPPTKKSSFTSIGDCPEYTPEVCSKELINVFEETGESSEGQTVFPTSGSTYATPEPQKEQLESTLQSVETGSLGKIVDPHRERITPQLPQDGMVVSDKEERTAAACKSEQMDSRTPSSKTTLTRPGRRPMGFLSLICSKNNLESEPTQVHSKKRLKPLIPVSRKGLKRSNPPNKSQQKLQESSDVAPPSDAVHNQCENVDTSATQVPCDEPLLQEESTNGQDQPSEEETNTISEYFFNDIFIEVDEME
ncbi:transcription factor TFIIIB component B'' homolog isoform X2 [Tenrec ecaudatus]|uniref:transcription factor TFIIIB component B'' homolog isoform X2 n=1 Tax=Tenrec ecaudatus TaxID=94439 RepID=UPI003F59CF8D